jgi:non-ribosomal peptide synthetase component E (peptide arylation enzyme)
VTNDVPRFPETFWDLVTARASATPDREMLVDDRGRTMTCGDFRDEAERVAAGFAALGVQAGMVVSWQLPTSLEGFVLLAALARLDAVQNPIIPVLREREVGFITGEVQADLLVVPGTWRGFDYPGMARTVAERVGCRVVVCAPDAGENRCVRLPADDPAKLSPFARANDGAPAVRWLYYSSGTTAQPKGARHTDASVMYAATGLLDDLRLGPDDRYPIAFPITHIGGSALLTGQLVSGCCLGVVEIFDPVRSPRFMADMGATLLGSALPFLRAYLDAQRAHGSAPLYPALRACASGGAPKPSELHYEIKEVLGGAGVISSYGLTEFPIATHARFEDDDDMLARTEGAPVARVDARVVDRDGKEVGRGEEGELRLKGPQMFAGYVDAALDEQGFDDDGWFRTGDLCVVEPGGQVRITGRLKDVIIRNAENISAQEIEDALLAHEQVADVTVIGLPDPKLGERTCAVVVRTDTSGELTLEALREHARGLGLANHKIPDQLELVDELPRNPMGKVLKADLRRRYSV